MPTSARQLRNSGCELSDRLWQADTDRGVAPVIESATSPMRERFKLCRRHPTATERGWPAPTTSTARPRQMRSSVATALARTVGSDTPANTGSESDAVGGRGGERDERVRRDAGWSPTYGPRTRPPPPGWPTPTSSHDREDWSGRTRRRTRRYSSISPPPDVGGRAEWLRGQLDLCSQDDRQVERECRHPDGGSGVGSGVGAVEIDQ